MKKPHKSTPDYSKVVVIKKRTLPSLIKKPLINTIKNDDVK